MPKYAIEARLHAVPELKIRHHYWLLRDLATGESIAELHGLPTDRESGETMPFGVADPAPALQVWHYIHAPAEGLWMSPAQTEFGESGLHWDKQTSRALFVGDAAEALTRWNSAASALGRLNALDLDFPSGPDLVGGDPVDAADDAASPAMPDDNSAYATLGEIMDVPLHTFEGMATAGSGLRLLDAAEIEARHFRAGGRHDGDVAVTENTARATAATPPAGNQRTAPDPADPSHPDHAMYRQSLAAVHALDASLGREPDDASARLAASMLLLARQGGLERIDHVILSRRTSYVGHAQNVFVVQNDPQSWAHRRAHIDTDAAVRTPAADTFAKLARLAR